MESKFQLTSYQSTIYLCNLILERKSIQKYTITKDITILFLSRNNNFDNLEDLIRDRFFFDVLNLFIT